MAVYRRSTRLSGISKATTITIPATETTAKEISIWQHRNPKNSITIHSDDEEEERSSNICINENKENSDLMNEVKQQKHSNKRAPRKSMGSEEPKTPKGKTKGTPASKKREMLKRLAKVDSADLDTSTDNEDSQEASPPKQVRQQSSCLAKHIVSPSRLLDRLSIDEKPEEEENGKISSKEPTASSPIRNKYQNARRILNSAECQNLPGREEQLDELRSFFKEHLEAKKSGSLYVSGQPGTGKTACLSLLIRSSEFDKHLKTVYVNCTSIASIGGVYKKLCAELNIKPQGRTERDHLQTLQHFFKTSPKMLLIVLDEIDQLCSSKQSVLYTIFEWPSLPQSKILLVGIANSLDLTERTLLRLNSRCELKPKHMHFPPYSKQQIVNIFKSRLEEAEVLDIFPPVTLQLLAAKVSAVSGDVRRALDIGRRVVEIAEQQKKAGEKEINLKNLNLPEGEQQSKAEGKVNFFFFLFNFMV